MPKNVPPIQTLGRLAGSCLQVHQALKRRPVNALARLSQETSLSLPTVTAALNRLGETGLVTELTGRRRNRVFSYPRYLEIKELTPSLIDHNMVAIIIIW